MQNQEITFNPRHKRMGYHDESYLISPQGAENITHKVLEVEESVRLINFVLQNRSITDFKLTGEIYIEIGYEKYNKGDT
ncbi:MAG: hypothetical protein GY834_11830 [Bacteroidetes bacterium]|nr:hypothetical protein [Bacteroidota bacterium]